MTGPDGDRMVWDRTLQRFFLSNHSESTAIPDTDPRARGMPLNTLLNKVHEGVVLSEWGLDNPLKGFFDGNGTFWYYDTTLAENADTFSLISRGKSTDDLAIRGPVQSIVPSGNWILVQRKNGITSRVRYDRTEATGGRDSRPISLEGRLIDVTSDGLYLTRTGTTLRTFRGNNPVSSRSFSSIRDVEVANGSIYVLTGRDEITRLDTALSPLFTFFLPGTKTYRCLAVWGDTVFVTAREGLFKGVLEESGEYFFSQSSRLDLTTIAGTLPDFSKKKSYRPRLWITANPDSTTVLVQTEENRIRTLIHRDTGFSGKKRLSVGQLSTSQFQYFKGNSTYWDGSQFLYHYFPDERVLEQYDTAGRLVKRRKFDFSESETLRNVEFLGATKKRVYFTGEVNDLRDGFRKNLITFNWKGEQLRVVDPVRPFATGDYTTLDEPTWDFTGGGNLYELHTGYVQIYDLKGYPRGIIHDVHEPVDVDRQGQTLFVLDLNGERLRTFRMTDSSSTRLGLPPSEVTVSGATGSREKTILTARSPDKNRLSLYEYQPNTYQFEQVLDHSRYSLRYPTLSNNGDTLFFFGKSPSSSTWTWFRSGTVKYAARALGTIKGVRGPGVLDAGRDLFFLPVKASSDTGEMYHYLAPNGDTDARLKNSESLKYLVPGKLGGFYGVQDGNEADRIVVGYLSRESDTSPLKWTVADTIYQSSESIGRLFVEDDYLFLVQQRSPGYTRIGKLPTGYVPGSSSGNTSPVQWLEEFRGQIAWLARNGSHYQILLQSQFNAGILLDWYPSKVPTPGGIRGQLKMRSPSGLSGIPLRTDPGGMSVLTRETGQFSMSEVPTGYVHLEVPNHENHFAYPVNLVIKSGEYTLRSSLPLAKKEELSLLEGGVNFFQRNRYGRAASSLNLFRKLVPSGPYHQWTDGIMEVIQREREKTLTQYKLFRERPELFDSSERLEIVKELEDPSKKLDIYRSYRGVIEPVYRQYFRYRTKILYGEMKDSLFNASSLKTPPTGESASTTGLPVLR